MHIVFVTSYFEPDSGAAAVRLSRLARILAVRGHQITVLAALPHYPRGQIAEAYRHKFAVVEDREGMRVIRTWLFATSSSRISRKLISQNSFMLTAALRGIGLKRPDVMLIEAQPVFTSLAGVFLSKIKRVPYVLNVSDLWPDHLLSVGALKESDLVYRVARRLVDFTYRGARGIVALSPAWAEAIKGYVGAAHENKVQVIYNGVDLLRFRPKIETADFRLKYALGDDRLVTFIGTFATQYDFETMLTVAQKLEGRNDVKFVFIGAGSQSEIVRAMLTKSTYDNVRWIDWIDHSEIPAAWNASALTYWAMRDQPLYRGTIPAKLYEALACGVPIAAATEGVGADMIASSGGGISVKCGDVDGLVEAIARFLDDVPLREGCSQSARAYAEAHFDPERVADAYEAALQGAIR